MPRPPDKVQKKKQWKKKEMLMQMQWQAKLEPEVVGPRESTFSSHNYFITMLPNRGICLPNVKSIKG